MGNSGSIGSNGIGVPSGAGSRSEAALSVVNERIGTLTDIGFPEAFKGKSRAQCSLNDFIVALTKVLLKEGVLMRGGSIQKRQKISCGSFKVN